MGRKLYNLTTHSQEELARILEGKWEVEVQPRLPRTNRFNWREIIEIVREAVKDIPTSTDVLVGGLTSYVLVIACIAQAAGWRLWVVVKRNGRVAGINRAPLLEWFEAEEIAADLPKGVGMQWTE